MSSVRRALSRMRVDPNIWLVLAFSLFAVLPLAGPDYFFGAHDAPHTVFFLTEFDAAIRDGVWYPGWATDQALGYGYPTFVFYPPLAYYVAEGFHLLGAAKVAAVKWTWALATVGAGLAMYAYARHVMGRKRGLLAAIVYVYVPYHLVDIYVRAALAEYASFVWMPLALLAFHRLVEKVTLPRIGYAGLAYGALFLSHNVTGLAFTPFLALYVLFRLLMEPRVRKERLVRTLAALGAALLAFGIAAAMLLPGFFERRYINQEQWVRETYDYADHFVQPAHLLSGTWGYAPGPPGTEGVRSSQLGAVPLILSIIATVAAFRRPSGERALALAFAAGLILLLFLMLPISAPVWELLPIVSLVQFPWRLLALAAVALAVLSGLAIRTPDLAGLDGRVLILALVAILGSYAYTLPQYTPTPQHAEEPRLSIEFELDYTDMRGMTAWTEQMPETSPMVEQYLAGTDPITAEALDPDAKVNKIEAGGASDKVWVESPEGTALRFYTYFFPGWRVYIDGERLPDEALRAETLYGLITVDVPPGEHEVLLRWGDTPLRLTGKVLTLFCLALATALVVVPAALRRRAAGRG
ncbi:MAG: glycosyltransferase family 39 protein [Anaerolineae bacterium]|jgi:hypothetical protein